MTDHDLLGQAIATVEIAVIVLDCNGFVLLSNPAACTLLGHQPDDLTGKHVSTMLPGCDSAALDAWIVPPATSVTIPEIEGVHRDGTHMDFRLHITAWQDPQAHARHTLILRDISRELRLERARNAELLRARNGIRGARIGVFEFDVLTNEAHVSDIWRDLMELAPGEIVDVQKEWRARVHPEDLAAADASVKDLAKGEDSHTVSEYRLFTRDRSALQWFRTDLAVVERDANGKPTRIVGAQVDVTDRKKGELALRKSMDQFQSAFDNAPIGKAVVDLNGNLLQVNTAFCTLVGRERSALGGIKLPSIMHPDDVAAHMTEFEELVNGERTYLQAEMRLLHKNGKEIWSLFNIATVQDEKGKVLQFITQIVDMSEQHRLQELKGEFVTTVSHELRTPLTSILGALKLLQAQSAEQQLPEPAQRLLDIALQNGERLGMLVSDILDFEKFSKDTLDLEIENYDLTELVRTAVCENRPLADAAGVTIATRIDAGPLHSPVDPARFGQVMANLLSNAAKFATKGTEVQVTLDRADDMARVVVRNRGVGIPEAFHAAIFSPFAQADPSLTRDHGGTGLGLSICKQIVDHLGGEIGFDSTPGAITDFWFTLPLSPRQQ